MCRERKTFILNMNEENNYGSFKNFTFKMNIYTIASNDYYKSLIV